MKTLAYAALPEDAGFQLKRILRAQMGISHRQLNSLKAQNGIYVNGEPVHVDCIVRAGDRIELRIAEDAACVAEPTPGDVDIVYQDDDLMILNKPAPLACQSSDRQPYHSLENRLAYLYQGEGFTFRPVNRLDRGTSGLMAVARHAHAQNLMQEQLHTPDFVREYLAILDGAPPQTEGTVDAPIEKCDGATVKRCVRPDGRPSVTHYRVLETRGPLTLVRLRLGTGRTHQIRVHMAYLGCPVFGDFLYGREDERLPGRFALHCAFLSLRQPLTGKVLSFEQPLPAELERLWRNAQR